MARIGRPRLPTHLKLIKGTARADRLNPREPQINKARGMPKPPHWLTKGAQQHWNEIVPVMYEVGIVTVLDGPAVGAYCQALDKLGEAEAVLAEMASRDEATKGLMVRTINGAAIQNPVLGAVNKLRNDVVKFAGELGLTPSARSRVTAAPVDGKEDPAAKYLA
jgi:P27 family predicted phage terminase small subunit